MTEGHEIMRQANIEAMVKEALFLLQRYEYIEATQKLQETIDAITAIQAPVYPDASLGMQYWSKEFEMFGQSPSPAPAAMPLPKPHTPVRESMLNAISSGVAKHCFQNRDMADSIAQHIPAQEAPVTPAASVELKAKAAPLYYLQCTRDYVGNCPMWWREGGNGYTTRFDARRLMFRTCTKPCVAWTFRGPPSTLVLKGKTSTNRELLELAAKAAGITLRSFSVKKLPPEMGDGFIGYMTDPDQWSRGWFNPLDDDGDALRLAVRLGISVVIRTHEGRRWAEAFTEDNGHDEWMDEPEPNAATRRAIVRAAAAIAASNQREAYQAGVHMEENRVRPIKDQ